MYENQINTILAKSIFSVCIQAAQLTGVSLRKIANENETYFNTNTQKMEIIPSECVAISLKRNKEVGDLSNFWKTVKMIDAELPNTRFAK